MQVSRSHSSMKNHLFSTIDVSRFTRFIKTSTRMIMHIFGNFIVENVFDIFDINSIISMENTKMNEAKQSP